MTWAAGDAAQCDLWFPPRKIPLEDGTSKLLPVLVITAAHSRFVTGRMIPTRKTEDLLGSWELIQHLGRVPRRLIWDNESGIGRGQRRAEGVASFMGTLATKLVLLPPNDPESKGLLERRNGWFETSFMPGRTFRSPADFNASSVTGWSRPTAGWFARSRLHRSTWSRQTVLQCCRCRRSRCTWLAQQDPVGPRLLLRLDTNDYSVDPAMIGRMVDVVADLERVRVRCEGRIVAEHVRIWARGATVTDSVHVETAAWLRKQFQQPRPVAASGDDLARDLADYDRAFGLHDQSSDQSSDGNGVS